jgi:hypothetical protein
MIYVTQIPVRQASSPASISILERGYEAAIRLFVAPKATNARMGEAIASGKGSSFLSLYSEYSEGLCVPQQNLYTLKQAWFLTFLFYCFHNLIVIHADGTELRVKISQPRMIFHCRHVVFYDFQRLFKNAGSNKMRLYAQNGIKIWHVPPR